MKKRLVIFLVLFLLVISAVYFLIPSAVDFSPATAATINSKGMHRTLFDESSWKNWWPDTSAGKENNGKNFNYHGVSYTITDKLVTSLIITIDGDHVHTNSSLTLIPVNGDSVELLWNGRIATGNNPFTRWPAAKEAKMIAADVAFLLERIRSFYLLPENMYGMQVTHASVTDSILVSTFTEIKHYPSPAEVYVLVDQLKQYMREKKALETGYPMLNITRKDTNDYLVRVAIPVNKRLPASGNISYKWMLGGGNILIAEIKGGQARVEQALRQLDFYVNDNRFNAPAIAFFSLVTDRRAVVDSNQWITRIYYPVM